MKIKEILDDAVEALDMAIGMRFNITVVSVQPTWWDYNLRDLYREQILPLKYHTLDIEHRVATIPLVHIAVHQKNLYKLPYTTEELKHLKKAKVHFSMWFKLRWCGKRAVYDDRFDERGIVQFIDVESGNEYYWLKVNK